MNITIDLHDVTFDAMGGTVNGYDKQLVKDQYKIPAFSGYVPTRDGGYIFAGWYSDAEFTTKVEAVDTASATDLTLYAKFTKIDDIKSFACSSSMALSSSLFAVAISAIAFLIKKRGER